MLLAIIADEPRSFMSALFGLFNHLVDDTSSLAKGARLFVRVLAPFAEDGKEHFIQALAALTEDVFDNSRVYGIESRALLSAVPDVDASCDAVSNRTQRCPHEVKADVIAALDAGTDTQRIRAIEHLIDFVVESMLAK